MASLDTDIGKEYLEGMYKTSGVALKGVLESVRGNQFEVSRLVGDVLAQHDHQEALLWRISLAKSGANTKALDLMIAPSVELLRRIRVQIIALGINRASQGELEYLLSSIHTGAEAQIKELSLDTVD